MEQLDVFRFELLASPIFVSSGRALSSWTSDTDQHLPVLLVPTFAIYHTVKRPGKDRQSLSTLTELSVFFYPLCAGGGVLLLCEVAGDKSDLRAPHGSVCTLLLP
eukprot:1143089-Pelagomonas_calceolata.AAC.7